MPQWGLTEKQRETGPWGLPGEVLKPGKVVTDPVHGDIHLSWLEVAITDSASYQRLRRVRQLGTTHLVYPGATHTRFSHSLGAVYVAQQLLDQVTTQRENLHAVPDLLEQWPKDTVDYHVARVTTLARLGALLHDLCHVPVGHSVEDDLKVLTPHDENIDRFEGLWENVRETVGRAIRKRWKDEPGEEMAEAVDRSLFQPGGELYGQLEPLIISKQRTADGEVQEPKPIGDLEYPFVADLVGNTICADLLDYLIRDHLFAGLPASLGDRFISAFFVVPKGRGPLSQRMALNIRRYEHERSDIVSELLKALRYRYELTERALYHHAKLSADAMLGEALERWSGALWLQHAAGSLEGVPGHEATLKQNDTYKLKRQLAETNKGAAEAADDAVRSELEGHFVHHGDDGLLERMSGLDQVEVPESVVQPTAKRLLRHSAQLATDLLNRDLFRIAGRVGYKDGPAEELYRSYGAAWKRDKLERSAEHFAELATGGDEDERSAPRVVIWLPDTKMRLKLAKVLVQHKAGISPFNQYESGRAQRGGDIYEAHTRLWSCFVFVHRDVEPEQERRVTTYLAGEMGVMWERHEHYGPNPSEWSTRLAIEQELDLPAWDNDKTEELIKELLKREPVSTRGAGTFSDLRLKAKTVYDELSG